MTTSVQSYLSKMEEKFSDSKTQEKVKSLNLNVLNDIGNQIIQSRIVIPQHQKKLKLKTSPFEDTSKFDTHFVDQRVNQIKQKKRQIMEQLQAVEMMESNIKMNRSTLKQSTASICRGGNNAKIKSEFTQDEMTKIKEIYRKQRKYQKKLREKIVNYQSQLQKYKQEQMEQQQKKHQQLCMERHEQREKYVKEIQERNNKREEMLQAEKQKIMQIKNKKKLFEKLEKNFLKEKQIQSAEMKEKLREHKKKRELSFEDVKKHQQKYLGDKRAKDSEREERLKNFKNVNQVKFPCLFLDKLKDDDQRSIMQKEQKRELVRTFADKKTAFAEQVRKKLHKNIKTMSQSKITQMKTSHVQQSPKWLNIQQKYQQGTKYMRQINAQISKLPKKVIQNKQNQHKIKFKNYLHQLKNQNTEKKKQQTKQHNLSNAFSNMSMVAANENVTLGNLTKSVKAKIQLMNKLQEMYGKEQKQKIIPSEPN